MVPHSLALTPLSLSPFQDGYTPLHIAAEKNAKEVAEILVRNGADVAHADPVRRRAREGRGRVGEER